MVQAPNKFTPPGPGGHGRVERRPPDQLRLFEGVLLTKVPQELKESNITRQIELAEATEHAQVGLEQGEQALRPILVYITTRIFLLRVIDVLMHIALQRPIATRRVRVEPTARLHRDVCSLLYGLHREIFGRMDDDRALATDPGDDGWPVFVVVASTRLTLFATTTCTVSQRLLATTLRLPLVTGGLVE